jgi:hypothetical protein
MLTFEQAKKLKKGDVVYEGKYKCFVVKIKVDKEAQKVAISYTDGSPDVFEGTQNGLSLTRAGEPEATPANVPAVAVEVPKKRKPRLTPMPKATDDPMTRLKVGVARHAEWRSLDWFEADRSKAAQSLSEKLGIPIEEFADTDKTASFHFLSLALAIAKWLNDSGWREIGMRDEMSMNQLEQIARSKVMAGILVRLFCHRYVQNIGQMPGLGTMVKAFTAATGVSETMFGHVLTAHTYVRQSTLAMARFIADGSEGDSPVKVGFFDPYREFLERDEDEFMPSDAVWDASLQLTCAMRFLNEQADLPVSLDGLPEGEAQAHHFLRNYLMMAGMHRTPAVFQLEKLSFKGATLGAAIESLHKKKPLVLLDAVFQKADGSSEIIVPVNPISRHNEPLAAFIGAEIKRRPPSSEVSIAIAMYPML